jgi:putative membrane protein
VRHLLIRWAILAVAVFVAAQIVEGIDVRGGFWSYVWVALALGLVNALIRPFVRLLTFPITVITLGLFSIVINALMLIIAAAFVDRISIENFGTAILAAIVISIVSALLNYMLRGHRSDW